MKRTGKVTLPPNISRLLPRPQDDFDPDSPTPSSSNPRETIEFIDLQAVSESVPSTKRRSTGQCRQIPVIAIDSDSEQLAIAIEATPTAEDTLLDQQSISYFKQKLNILPASPPDEPLPQQPHIQPSIQSIPTTVPAPPPLPIHKYPPYVLGPRDVWPPKYPNSWREFKRDMRENRKFD